MATIKCPKCGATCEDTVKFCSNCAYPISVYVEGLKNRKNNEVQPGGGVEPTPVERTVYNNDNPVNNSAPMNNIPVKNIPPKKSNSQVWTWIFVVFAGMTALTALARGAWLSFLIFTLLALFISPLRKKLSIDLPKGAVIAIGIVLYILGAAFYSGGAKNVTEEVNEVVYEETEIEEVAETPASTEDSTMEEVVEETAEEAADEKEPEDEEEIVVLPFPSDDEITDVDDYKAFYKDYADGDDEKWFRITVPVYSVSDGRIIAHDDLGKILGMISIRFADPAVTEGIHINDNVTVVAYSKYKFMNTLFLQSAYLENAEETANSIHDDEVVIIDDYVFFYNNYDSHDIGKTVQITAPAESIDSNNITIKEGLPDTMTTMIVAYWADDEDIGSLKAGDTVTFYGKASSKIGKSLTIDDAHVGEAPFSNSVTFEESDSYQQKVEESQKEIEYTKVTVKQMLDDMDSNPVRAKDTYENQYLEVTGVVCDIAGNGKSIDLGTSKNSTLDSILCILKESSEIEKVKSISNGDMITVRGKCYQVGKVLGYGLTDCKIVE